MDADKISIKLAPENKWLPMIAEAVRHYASILNIPDLLCSMVSDSLIEGCEELIRICAENGIDDSYEISLDFSSDAIVTQITYNGKIPLNPHETIDYEVPDDEGDLLNVNLDSLWLHLIKKRMDRVFFRVDGNRQTLQMMKYRREAENPRQFWIMGRAPKLKSGVSLEFQSDTGDSNGQRGAILQNQENGSVLKLDPVSAYVVKRLDGANTFQEIYMEYIDDIGMISPHRLALIFEKLEQSDMLAGENDGAKNKFLGKVFSFIINPIFSIPKSDRIVSTVYKCFSFFFNPIGFAVLLLVGLSGAIPLIQHFNEFKNVVLKLGDFYFKNPSLLIITYLAALLIVIIHEFGHGLICKHYGGKIGRMGIMFYMTMFIFYCDTSSAWNFPGKKRRIMVSLGGPLTTFAILGVNLWMFGMYSGIHSTQAVFWGALSFFCLFGLAMNFNPFIKMDAYYVLMDSTGINNLRKRSFDFIKNKFFPKTKGPSEEADKALSPKERRIFWFYGVMGIIVTTFFIVFPLFYYSYRLLFDGKNKDKLVFIAIVIILSLAQLSHKAFTSIRSMRKKVYKIS